MVSAILALLLAPRAVRDAGGLSVENLTAGALVRTPAVVLRGRSGEGAVTLRGVGAEASWPVVDGRWAGLVELRPGINFVAVRGEGSGLRMRIDYRPMRTPVRVQAAYLLASDEAAGYLGAEGAGESAVRARVGTMVKTIQAFCAEAMEEAGYGRKAFAYVPDAEGEVAVDFVRLPQTGAELRKLDGNALYALVEPLMKARYPEGTTKALALMGFTRYDARTGAKLAHTALGGGSLALFGSGPMRFWPLSIPDAARAFTDGRRVDPAVEFDDSGLREVAWANAATTFGACLHELGHAFGLPHSPDAREIMSRGFDRFNRSFVLREPRDGKPDAPYAPETRAYWSPAWAARLDLSPWFQPDGSPKPEGAGPAIEVKGGTATLSGTDLRLFGFWVEGANFAVTEARSFPLSGGAKAPVDLEALRKGLKPGERLHLFLEDRFGRETDVVAS